MLSAWPVADIRAAERRVMARRPDGELMQRAAFAITVEASAMLQSLYGTRVLLLVGAGDNGGDALFAGSLLARRGCAVQAVLADPARAHAEGLAAFRASGGRVVASDAVCRPELIIDGLVGIGASGPLRDTLAPLVRLADSFAAPVLAVDVPSGVDPNSGAVPGAAVSATVTVCVGALKPGLLLGPGREHAGEVRVIDIGLGPELPVSAIHQLTEDEVAAALPRSSGQDDKYSRGVLGVAAGSTRYPGAAVLCVGSGLLGGVGAVRYAGTAAQEVVRRFPEVLVSDSVLDAGRVQAWVVGPGFGDGPQADSALQHVMSSDVAVLVDADGLTALAAHPEWLRQRTAPTILTPHDREFERLFGAVGPDRLAAARRAAASSGATVLLKGFATVIADPSGQCFVNPTGHPSLATAGSGDVLSGLIGSLLAAGLDPLHACAVGAFLHGAAAHRGIVSASDLLVRLRDLFL